MEEGVTNTPGIPMTSRHTNDVKATLTIASPKFFNQRLSPTHHHLRQSTLRFSLKLSGGAPPHCAPLPAGPRTEWAYSISPAANGTRRTTQECLSVGEFQRETPVCRICLSGACLENRLIFVLLTVSQGKKNAIARLSIEDETKL